MTDISVIGLGAMGSALAKTLLEANFSVTVWNRTEDKAKPLACLGAAVAATFDQAVAASPKVIFCLPGYEASGQLLSAASDKDLLTDRIIIQLSTASPKEAADAEHWFSEQNASFLAGAILCWPGNIGTESGKIVIAGNQSIFDASRLIFTPLLKHDHPWQTHAPLEGAPTFYVY